MRILPIFNSNKSLSFGGVKVNYSGTKPYLLSHELYHSNSSSEKTLDVLHSNRTNQIYFADPMESVSLDIKKEVDYVVYDNEPAYPDLDKELKNAYLGDDKYDYSRQFENIRDYFNRRENAGWANKAEAQYQQWQSAECLKLYNQAKDLIRDKNQLLNSCTDTKIRIEQTKGSIELTDSILEKVKNDKKDYDDMIDSLSKKQRLYSELKAEIDKDKLWNKNSERNFVEQNLIHTTKYLNYQKQKEPSIKFNISKLEDRKADLVQTLEKYEKTMADNLSKLDSLKETLSSHFQNLKNFYEKQNIKKF